MSNIEQHLVGLNKFVLCSDVLWESCSGFEACKSKNMKIFVDFVKRKKIDVAAS